MRVIEFLREAAPWWWALSGTFGLLVCGYMVKEIRKAYPVGRAMQRDKDMLRTLSFMVRLVVTGSVFLFLMALAGVLSIISEERSIPSALVIYFILLALPLAFVWIIYRAIRLRVQ